MKQQVILKKWRARIDKAKTRGYFTDYDKSLALNWGKCAIGERDCMCEKVIPNNPSVWNQSENYDILISEKNSQRGSVVARKMYARVSKLGSGFHTCVILDRFDKALAVLKQIEVIPKERFYR